MNKSDLVKAMAGQLTTNNWDVVCCYNETKINALLSEKYQQGHLVSQVVFQCTYHDDLFDLDVTISAELTLKEPQLQFQLGERYLCLLTMPIEAGTYTMSSSDGRFKKTDIPKEALMVTCLVPMAAISGDSAVHSGGQVVVFDDALTMAQVILHFNNTEETVFDVKPMPNAEQQAAGLDLLKPQIKPAIIDQLKRFFKDNVREIDYAVGGVAKVTSPAGQVTLQPKSFIFSASKPDVKTDGTLNLYIQTQNSGNPQGDMVPAFQPGGTSMLPIPDGYTASMIVSADLLLKTYVQPQFKALGWTVSSKAVGEGVEVQLAKSDGVRIPGVHKMGVDQEWSQDVNVSFQSNPFTVLLNKNNLNVTWNFQQDVRWTSDFVCVQTGDVTHEDGVIQVNASCNKLFPLKVAAGSELHFDFTLAQSDFSAGTTRKSGGCPDFLSSAGDIGSQIQASVLPKIGTFSFNLNNIDVFSVSNLLFPGKNIFNIDAQEGFHVPRDLILFGNVADHLPVNPASLRALKLAAGPGQPVKDAPQFIAQILGDDGFASACLNKLTGKAPDFDDYLQAQGFDFQPDDLARALQAEAAQDLKVWGGVYKFLQPPGYQAKSMKISSKTGALTIDDAERTVTAQADGSFQWSEGTGTAAIRFADHQNTDGTVGANTFAGTITTPQDGGRPALVESVTGEQVISGSDSAWLTALEIVGVIAGVVGIPLMFKGFYDWIKDCRRSAPVAPASVDQVQQLAETQKELMKKAALDQLDPISRQMFDDNSDDFLEEYGDSFGGQAVDACKRDDMRGLGIEEMTTAIEARLREAANNFVKDKVKAMQQIELRQEFDGLADGMFMRLDRVLNFKEAAVQRQIEVMSRRVLSNMGAADYLKKCVKSAILSDQLHSLGQDAERITRDSVQAAGSLDLTRGELADVGRTVTQLQDQIQHASQPDVEQLKEQLKAQLDQQRQLREQEKAERERVEALERQQDEKQHDIDQLSPSQDAARREREEAGHHIPFVE